MVYFTFIIRPFSSQRSSTQCPCLCPLRFCHHDHLGSTCPAGTEWNYHRLYHQYHWGPGWRTEIVSSLWIIKLAENWRWSMKIVHLVIRLIGCFNFVNTVEPKIENFHLFFAPSCYGCKFYRMNFLSHVNDYMEPMAIFTAWAKFFPLNICVMQG